MCIRDTIPSILLMRSPIKIMIWFRVRAKQCRAGGLECQLSVLCSLFSEINDHHEIFFLRCISFQVNDKPQRGNKIPIALQHGKTGAQKWIDRIRNTSNWIWCYWGSTKSTRPHAICQLLPLLARGEFPHSWLKSASTDNILAQKKITRWEIRYVMTRSHRIADGLVRL